MSVMTIRDIPDDLMDFLRTDAAENHRSMNKQVIVILEEYRARRLAEQAKQKIANQTKNQTR
jgi:plasmid stability protein